MSCIHAVGHAYSYRIPFSYPLSISAIPLSSKHAPTLPTFSLPLSAHAGDLFELNQWPNRLHINAFPATPSAAAASGTPGSAGARAARGASASGGTDTHSRAGPAGSESERVQPQVEDGVMTPRLRDEVQADWCACVCRWAWLVLAYRCGALWALMAA